ncbi:MAG: hypothetical protein HQL60_02555 [Magnetococcales bacterium]|nr:hypothetical protein [Magnetococcales bacterium]
MAKKSDTSGRGKGTASTEPEEPMTPTDKGIHKVFHDSGDKRKEAEAASTKPKSNNYAAGPTPKTVNSAAISRLVTNTLLVLSVVAAVFIGLEIKKEWQKLQPAVIAPDKSATLAITTPPPQGMVIAGSTLPLLAGRVYHHREGLGILVGHNPVVDQKAAQKGQTPKLWIDQVAIPQSDGLFHVNDLSLGVSGVFDIHALLVEKNIWEPWSREYNVGNREPLASLPKALDHKTVRVKTGTPP